MSKTSDHFYIHLNQVYLFLQDDGYTLVIHLNMIVYNKVSLKENYLLFLFDDKVSCNFDIK